MDRPLTQAVVVVACLFSVSCRASSTPAEAGVESPTQEQAVLVYIDATDLPRGVAGNFDVATLENQLEDAIRRAGVGEFDGREFGPTEIVLYMYGPDAERLFTAIEPVLSGSQVSQSARVVIRRGGPDAPFREVRLTAR